MVNPARMPKMGALSVHPEDLTRDLATFSGRGLEPKLNAFQLREKAITGGRVEGGITNIRARRRPGLFRNVGRAPYAGQV